MDESHLVNETLSNTNEHILDKASESVDLASLLISAEPHLDRDVLSFSNLLVEFDNLEFTSDVFEALLNLSLGPFNNDLPGFDGNFDAVRDLNKFFSEQEFHVNFYIK